MAFKNIAVLGLGKVGTLAALLLHDSDFNVTGFDNRQLRKILPFPVEVQDMATSTSFSESLKPFDAVLS